MNHSKFSSLTRSRSLALGLVLSGAVGLLAACSSDGGNAGPSTPPPINTGGGGDGGSNDGEAGETSGGNGGSDNGGSGNGGETNGGEAGEAGAAGAAGGGGGPVVPECTLVGDLAFLNQPASGFNEEFNNTQRLGTQTTLPPLP